MPADPGAPVVPGAEPWSADGNEVGILVLHGFTGSPASMKPWGRALADQGWTVRVPLLPGHGTRWQDLNLTTWEDWYAEAERHYRELADRCRYVFVMGLSVGGTLSLRLAEVHGDGIAGIVAVNPAVHSENRLLLLLPVLKRVLAGFPGIVNDIAKPGQDEVGYDKLPLKAVDSLTRFWKLTKDDLPKVSQPLIVLHSAVDHVIEPSNSEHILANVFSTDKEEVVLADSYHVATLDYDAEVIVRDSIAFVRRLTA
jgi:carboxylesterase